MRIAVILLCAVLHGAASAQLVDNRYCGTPARDAAGNIKRSSTVTRWFQILHPCPATGLTSGPCPGWYRDHVIPLACGGCDAISNLQWLPEASWRNKSLWERAINGQGIAGTERACPVR